MAKHMAWFMATRKLGLKLGIFILVNTLYNRYRQAILVIGIRLWDISRLEAETVTPDKDLDTPAPVVVTLSLVC